MSVAAQQRHIFSVFVCDKTVALMSSISIGNRVGFPTNHFCCVAAYLKISIYLSRTAVLDLLQ